MTQALSLTAGSEQANDEGGDIEGDDEPADDRPGRVSSRNQLARAIAGAATSGLTKDEIIDLTGYPADLVLRICRDARISPLMADPPMR